jgi:alpha-N-arabinofuranosidase
MNWFKSFPIMKNGIVLLLSLLTAQTLCAREFQVSVKGDDQNDGTAARPFRTISAAARVAQPGDVITVHEGVYRERISPPRGGKSDRKRIIYQAAPGETVAIKGSEVVTYWVQVHDDVWKVTLPNSFFGGFNPYNDLIHGDWFEPKHREHHTGAVYLNGDWLTEAAKLDDVLKPMNARALWFGQVDQQNTTIWAQFKGVNPNEQLVEINVRQTVFYPEQTGINYLTVRGFTLEQAATPWAPPTAEQIGLIGTHWSKGWIIESNVVRYSTCSGIALGKYGDQWDNTSANTAEGYVATINHALTNGWTRENIGHHLVRNNIISHCEQTGIVGSLGAAFSTVTGNTIHDIHVRKLFTGAEMAGIKFHGAIDVQITRNHIYRTCLGLWLDWMAQGTCVSDNLLNNNDVDVLVEVDHGPFLLDNNLFLSRLSLMDRSQGGAYVHNLFAGTFDVISYDGRQTPFLKPHSTQVAGYHDNPGGDDRFYNNLFVGRADLRKYDKAQLPVWMDGNVFLNGALPSAHETNAFVQTNSVPAPKLVEEADGLHLQMKQDPAWTTGRTRKLVTTKLLGRTIIPNAPFERPDGARIRIDTDYFGQSRNASNPAPGPFEHPGPGGLDLKVWNVTK